MAAMTLSTLLAGHARVPPEADVTVSGLSLDSRSVHPGNLFLAARGTRGHGLDHLDDATARQAAAVAWEPADGVDEPSTDLPAVPVADLRARAGSIAGRFYGEPSKRLAVVGITGTNGKTSCTHLLAQATDAAGGVGGVVGTLGTGRLEALDPAERTTPDPVTIQRRLADMAATGCTLVAMEVSSHALDQDRTAGIHFLLGVFTNLSHDHLDYHGDMAAYGRAKRRLFEAPGLEAAALNLDDSFGRELAESLPDSLARVTYGLDSPDADVRADDLTLRADGLAFRLITPAGEAPVTSALLGRFNASNLLAVAASLHALGWIAGEDGLPTDDILGSRPDAARLAGLLSTLQPVAGRMERLSMVPGRPVVVIDYAHTPDALEQALAALREHCPGRLICLFGCGGERDTGKRALMGAVAERLADAVFVTDDNPRGEDGDAIVRQVLAGMTSPDAVRVIREREHAVAAAIEDGDADDLVLLAGKGHETSQEIGGVRHAYSERDAALAALGEVRA